MVLRNCFLQQRTTCGILLVLVCALVDCPRGEYGFRSLRFQGFFVHRNLVRSGCRPVCCSSVGICYSFLLQYQDRQSAMVFLCSFEHGSVYAWVLLRKCRSVCCEVFPSQLQEFRSVYVRFANANTSVDGSSTYVKAAAGLGRFG